MLTIHYLDSDGYVMFKLEVENEAGNTAEYNIPFVIVSEKVAPPVEPPPTDGSSGGDINFTIDPTTTWDVSGHREGWKKDNFSVAISAEITNGDHIDHNENRGRDTIYDYWQYYYVGTPADEWVSAGDSRSRGNVGDYNKNGYQSFSPVGSRPKIASRRKEYEDGDKIYEKIPIYDEETGEKIGEEEVWTSEYEQVHIGTWYYYEPQYDRTRETGYGNVNHRVDYELNLNGLYTSGEALTNRDIWGTLNSNRTKLTSIINMFMEGEKTSIDLDINKLSHWNTKKKEWRSGDPSHANGTVDNTNRVYISGTLEWERPSEAPPEPNNSPKYSFSVDDTYHLDRTPPDATVTNANSSRTSGWTNGNISTTLTLSERLGKEYPSVLKEKDGSGFYWGSTYTVYDSSYLKNGDREYDVPQYSRYETQSFTFTEEGMHRILTDLVDVAKNTSTHILGFFKIDKTDPEIYINRSRINDSGSFLGGYNLNTWSKDRIRVILNAEDNLSGFDSSRSDMEFTDSSYLNQSLVNKKCYK